MKELLTEIVSTPLHLTACRAAIALCGTFRAKAHWDALPRRGYAYGLLRAAGIAQKFNLDRISAVEFGVANGAGLEVLCRYRDKVQDVTGVMIDVLGVDSGKGLPNPQGWRDLPECWHQGEFSAQRDLRAAFAHRAKLIIGPMAETLSPSARHYVPAVAFASIDVDYFSSAMVCLRWLSHYAAPFCSLYLDDVEGDTMTEDRGELGAVNQFNYEMRDWRVGHDHALTSNRPLRVAPWHRHMRLLSRREYP